MTTLQETPVAPVAERQIVVLHLADEVYGLDIGAIHTVITPQPITAVPKASAHIKGVINLRGRVLPVLDLRTRFGLPPRPAGESAKSRIVIVDADGVSAGLIVDAVSEVLRLPITSIDPPSQLITSVATDCITGIGRLASGKEERLVILLDVGKILSSGVAAITTADEAPMAKAA